MSNEFEIKLDLASTLKADRNEFPLKILENKKLYTGLFQDSFRNSNKNTIKAIWTLEMVYYAKPE